MLTSLPGIRMMMGIASDSDTIREDVSYVGSPATYRAQENWLLLWLQWLVRCDLSQTSNTPEFLEAAIMPKEIQELVRCPTFGTGEVGINGLLVVDGFSPVFSIKHSDSPPFCSRLVVSPE